MSTSFNNNLGQNIGYSHKNGSTTTYTDSLGRVKGSRKEY